MKEKGSLGIFLSGDRVVAVWTSTDATVRHTLSVTTDADDPVTMALQAARVAAHHGFGFDEVFVAIDCCSYMQYNLHSEFEDYRQIESTIKFDAEEAAATDVTDLAVTFEVSDTDENGSQVTVYTADRQFMKNMLLDLQKGGLDPTFIEPDVVCLARALEQISNFSARKGNLFAVLSAGNCYMLLPNQGYGQIVRTFLVEPKKDVTNMLVREVLLTTALGRGDSSLKAIVLMGQADTVNHEMLNTRTGLEISVETPESNLVRTTTEDSKMTCGELLVAYGATLSIRPRIHRSDFRRDYMPYQGKRKVMEGSLRLIGISLTVLMIVVAVVFQLKTSSMNSYSKQLTDKMLAQYKAVMYGKSPRPGTSPITLLKRDYSMAQREKKGLDPGDSKSVPAKLSFLFEIINKLPMKVDVKIDQIKITEKTMSVKGDTNNRSSTRALLDAIKKHPAISLESEQLRQNGNRDSFGITIDPK